MKFKEGDKVIYCGKVSTVVNCHFAKPYGHKLPTYDVTYPNNFSSLNSRSTYVREDLLKKV